MEEIVERSTGKCYFYIEEQIASDDILPDHLRWLEVLKNFKISMGLHSDQEALVFLTESLKTLEKFNDLTAGKGIRRDFLLSLIG
jgi:hypothetical protein